MARLRLRRGVFLLPSLLTTGNIFCGFTSIVMAFEGQMKLAASLIIVAAILDGLDGRIARLMGGTSEFGGEYDSLADVVSFGLAPAFLAHVWGLMPLRRYGWVLAFLFLVCGAVRLARFNIQHGASDRRWFVGLPIPMAATALAGCVLVFRRPLADRPMSVLFGVWVLAIALLMVSRFRYRSFKDIDVATARPFRSVVAIVVIFAAIALNYRLACLAIAVVYVASGPVLWAASLRRSGRRPGAAGDPAAPGGGSGNAEDRHAPGAGGGPADQNPVQEIPSGAR